MSLFKDRYRVESTRLRAWDYAGEGCYFLTLCTRNRECLLGDVLEGEMQLSGAGKIVAEEWRQTEQLRKNVTLDEWVVMPNHLHGIIVVHRRETSRQETPHRGASTGGLKAGSLGAIIGQFKSVCTKRSRAAGFDFDWQSRFYDQIIRDEEALAAVREYIINNPGRWDLDRNNPANL